MSASCRFSRSRELICFEFCVCVLDFFPPVFLKCFLCISGHEVSWHIWSPPRVALEGKSCLFQKIAMLIMLSRWICVRWQKKKKSARFPPALCTLLYTVYCNLGGSCHIEFSHYPVYTAGLTLQTEYTGWDWTISHTHTHTSLIYEFKLIFKLMVKTEGGLRYVFLQTGPLWWVCCLPTVKHCWPLMACETAEKEKQHRAEKQGRWAGKVSIKGFKSLKALSRTTWDV